jgi:hypothetical protein
MIGAKLATKGLTWVMAALALLQSLQGSALACQLGVCHSRSESRSQACCSRSSISSGLSGESHRDGGLKHIAKPSSPCKCPTSCWCRRPTQAVVQPSELIPMADAKELVASWSPGVDANSATPVVSAPIAPLTAQQVCALLCRFLA